MRDNHQPLYFYLSDDAVESLAFRVALRKVSDSPIATSRVNTCSELCVPSGNTGAIFQTIGWQEKLPEPREAITRLRQDCHDELLDVTDTTINAIIFTYTDQDLSDSIKYAKRNNARWAEYNRNKEDPFQVMKIVVAVDCNCKSSLEENISFHEEVLCSIRLHRSGRLTITPCTRDSGTNYDHPVCIAQFTTPKGVVYEYSLEWLTKPFQKDRTTLIKGGMMNGRNQQLDATSLQLRQRRLHLLRSTLQRRLQGKGNTPTQHRTLVEIISAQSSADCQVLSVDYSVVLPDRIKVYSSESPLNGASAFTSSFSSSVERNDAGCPKEFCIRNVAILLSIVVLSGLARKIWNNFLVLCALPCVFVVLNSITGVWALQGISNGRTQFFFDAKIDFSYHIALSEDEKSTEAEVSLSGHVSQQLYPKLILKLLSKSGLQTRVEGYGAVHIPIDNPGTYYVTAHLWRPIGDTNRNQLNELKRKLEEYYIGGAYHMLKENIEPGWKPRSCTVTDISSNLLEFESRYGMRSESSGTSIQIRVTNYTSSLCRKQNLEKQSKIAATRPDDSDLKNINPTVDELVARLRRNRMERKIRRQSSYGAETEISTVLRKLDTSLAVNTTSLVINDAEEDKMSPKAVEAPLVVDPGDAERTIAVLKKIQCRRIERSKSLLNEKLRQFS